MRLLLFAIIVLLLVPFVYADMTVDSITKEKYNLGDKIAVSGDVEVNDNTKGYLNYNLLCGETQELLLIQSVNLVGQQPFAFSQNIPLLKGLGTCNIKIDLNDNTNANIETVTSSQFEITKNLDADFAVIDKRLKLGESLNITGTIFRLNGANVNGLATVTLKLGTTPYLIDSKDVDNGDFDYTTTLSSLPQGSYTIEVFVRDLNGNEQLFENVTSFEVNNQLSINAAVNKLDAKPGEEIIVSGEIKDSDGEAMSSNVTAYIELNGEDKYNIILKDGKFENKIKLKTDATSGNNKISIIAEDEYGNFGEKAFFVNVISVPTRLEIKTSASTNPGEEANVIVILYDQANKEIAGKTVQVEISDDKKAVVKETALTGSALKFTLAGDSKPGEWTIKAVSEGLEQNSAFSVNQLEKVDVQLSGQKLTIVNDGNIDFKKGIEISFNEFRVVKNLDLEPKETKTIELDDEAEDGTYSLKVLAGNQQFEFGNVTVSSQGGFGALTGAAIGGAGSFWWIIVLVVVIAALLVWYFKFKGKGPKNQGNYSRERDYREAQKKLQIIKEERERKKGKKRLFQGPPPKEEDIKDFRETVIKDLVEREKKEKQNLFRRRDEGGNEGYKI